MRLSILAASVITEDEKRKRKRIPMKDRPDAILLISGEFDSLTRQIQNCIFSDMATNHENLASY